MIVSADPYMRINLSVTYHLVHMWRNSFTDNKIAVNLNLYRKNCSKICKTLLSVHFVEYQIQDKGNLKNLFTFRQLITNTSDIIFFTLQLFSIRTRWVTSKATFPLPIDLSKLFLRIVHVLLYATAVSKTWSSILKDPRTRTESRLVV